MAEESRDVERVLRIFPSSSSLLCCTQLPLLSSLPSVFLCSSVLTVRNCVDSGDCGKQNRDEVRSAQECCRGRIFTETAVSMRTRTSYVEIVFLVEAESYKGVGQEIWESSERLAPLLKVDLYG
eukprot:762445-Hanusia_phi.AAC.2